ncbi:hypothetical protein HOP50_12g66830 [Chloropicon primus]|nr:hypothetical protein HOP50_12g66830 [Chloropicon primus]
MAMDVDGESMQTFLTGSTTIIEEESGSEEGSGVAGSSFQPGSSQVTMMGGNARPIKTRNGKRTLVAAIYRVLQGAGERLRVKEILDLIRAKKFYAIAKEYLNRSTADNLNEEDSNTTANNNNITTSSPSPYALDLREALESGLMTEEEYAEAVQEAQRYDSKSPEKIADCNEALRSSLRTHLLS